MIKNALLVVLLALVPTVALATPLAHDEFGLFKLKLGGFFYGAAHYDTNNTAVRPWVNQVLGPTTQGALSFDPYGTRTNLSVETTNSEGPKANALLEIDWAPVATPRIRHAYAVVQTGYVDVLLGQYWVPFGTPGPDTYNPMWFSKQGNSYSRAPQLTLSRGLGPVDVSVTALAASMISGTIVKGNGAAGTYAYSDGPTPAGFLRVAYPFAQKKGFVSLTGGAGKLSAAYKTGSATDAARPTANVTTLFGELAFSVPVSILTITGKAFLGSGSGLGTGVGQTMVIAADDTGSAIPVRGGFLSVKAKLTDQFVAGVSFGDDDPVNEVSGVVIPIYNNTSFGAEFTWLATTNALLALEWEHVATTNSTASGAATYPNERFSLVSKFSF